MGHCVTGIISNFSLLKSFSDENKIHSPVKLTNDLAIIALRDDDIDSLIPSKQTGEVNGFTYLSDQLIDLLKNLSDKNIVMYFETDYFGGTGIQSAIVFQNNDLLFGPISDKIGPINHALRLLGVKVIPPLQDEFESVGLDKHRLTEDWVL